MRIIKLVSSNPMLNTNRYMSIQRANDCFQLSLELGWGITCHKLIVASYFFWQRLCEFNDFNSWLALHIMKQSSSRCKNIFTCSSRYLFRRSYHRTVSFNFDGKQTLTFRVYSRIEKAQICEIISEIEAQDRDLTRRSDNLILLAKLTRARLVQNEKTINLWAMMNISDCATHESSLNAFESFLRKKNSVSTLMKEKLPEKLR